MHYINTVSRVTTESSSSKSITYSWQASTSARLCCMLAFMHGAMATSQTAVSTLLSTWSIWMSILLYQEYGTLQFNVDVLFDITQKCTRYNILLMSIDTCFCFNGEILWVIYITACHFTAANTYQNIESKYCCNNKSEARGCPPEEWAWGLRFTGGVRPALYQRRALVASLAHTRTDQLSWTPLPVATTSAADTLTGADFCFHAIPI